MSEVLDTIELVVDARQTRLEALTRANRMLDDMGRHLDAINNKLAGLNQPVVFKKSAADIKEMITQAERLGRFGKAGAAFKPASLNPKEMAKALGYDPKAVESFITQSMLGGRTKVQQAFRRQMRELVNPEGEFRNVSKASKFFEQFTKRYDPKQNPINALQMLFGGGSATGTAQLPGGKVDLAGGPVQLTVPPSQIVATLGPGPIQLTIPAAQVAGVGGGSGGSVGGAAVPASKTGPKAEVASPATGGIVTQIRTEQPSGRRRVRTVSGSTTTDTIGDKQIVTEDLKAAARERLLQGLEKIETEYQKSVAKVLNQNPKERNFSDITAAGTKAGQQAKALAEQKQFAALDARSRKTLTDKFSKGITTQATGMADRLEAEMLASFERVGKLRAELAKVKAQQDKAAQQRIAREIKAEEQRQLEIGRMYQARDAAQEKITTAKQKTAAFEKQSADDAVRIQTTHQAAQAAIAELQQRGAKISERTVREVGAKGKLVDRREVTAVLDENGQRTTRTAKFSRSGASLTERTGATPAGGEGWLSRGLKGLSPGGFAKNLMSIAAWSAAVSALYAPLTLINYTLGQTIEIGLQTARLSQTFRGVGGTAQELRDDIIALASATGQSSRDAMESAVAWSRLGLSRQQDAEAVRVSLMAANVAEMTAAESTEHLAAVTSGYKLRVSELEGVLGMLNQTSNTARVRNADLLVGLSNVAAVGREAGFSLAELNGILGASVELSGQTGSRMSNALKNVITRLGREDVQGYLRRKTGIDTVKPDGSEKSRSEVLRELFLAYTKLNEAERTNLAGRVAGAHQANRFTAIMDSYLRAQQLAIDSQLNLNSAQQENAKIIATLKSQLAGLRSEWDRFAARSGLEEALARSVRALKDLLRLMDLGGGGSRPQDFRTMTKEQLLQKGGHWSNPLGKDYEGAQDELTRRWFKRRKAEGKSTGFWDAMGAEDEAGNRQPIGFKAWLKYRAETPFELGEEKFRNDLQELRSRSAGKRDEAKFYDTVAQVLKEGRPDAQKAAVDLMTKRFGADGAKFQTGDANTRQAMLAAAKQKSLAESNAASEQAAQRAQQRLLAAERRQAELEKIITAQPGTKAAANANDELQVLQERMQDLKAVNDQAWAKYNDDLLESLAGDAKVLDLRQEQLALLQRQDDILKSIADSWQLVSAPTAAGRLQQQSRMLSEQIGYMEEFQNSPEFRRQFTTESQQLEQEKKLKELKAQRDALNDPALRQYAERFDVSRRRSEQGERSLVPFNYGSDATEKLQRQIAELERRQAALQNPAGPLTAAQSAELDQTNLQLEQRKKELLDRQYEVQREINQLLVDRNKEIQKSFFGSGAEELLRKLAAFRLAFDKNGRQRDLSLGQFYSMNPGMRGDLALFNPNFDPEMQGLKREQSRFGKNNPMPVMIVNPMTPPNPGASPHQPAASPGAKSGADEPLLATLQAARATMDQFTGSVTRAGAALDRLTERVDKLTAREQAFDLPHNPQAGGNRSGTNMR